MESDNARPISTQLVDTRPIGMQLVDTRPIGVQLLNMQPNITELVNTQPISRSIHPSACYSNSSQNHGYTGLYNLLTCRCKQ